MAEANTGAHIQAFC